MAFFKNLDLQKSILGLIFTILGGLIFWMATTVASVSIAVDRLTISSAHEITLREKYVIEMESLKVIVTAVREQQLLRESTFIEVDRLRNNVDLLKQNIDMLTRQLADLTVQVRLLQQAVQKTKDDMY